MTIELPNGWRARDHQAKAWNSLIGGVKRAVLVWHRRAGKDALAINFTALSAMERPGVYWHMAPKQNQARKIIWDAVDSRTGVKHIDQAFPKAIRKRTREQEMQIELLNGSIWQVVGSDNYNVLVGAPPCGIVFSEYSLSKPQAWAYLLPILVENDGWAIFPFTPRGKNHGHKVFELARSLPGKWFSQLLTVEDTGMLTQEQLDEIKNDYCMNYGVEDGTALFEQEFYCSWLAALVGSYYGKDLERADKDGRVGQQIAYDRHLELHTAWDIGGTTAIWFFQITKLGQARFIHYHESTTTDLDYYARYLDTLVKDRGWRFTCHWMPHDFSEDRSFGGRSRRSMLEGLGVKPIRILDKISIVQGINYVHRLLGVSWFAKECEEGVDLLRLYHRAYDEERRVYRDVPEHDFTSHCADAMRYAATAIYHHLGGGLRADEGPRKTQTLVGGFSPRNLR